MRCHWTTGALATALTALAVAGCGGAGSGKTSSDTTTRDTQAATKADYIRQANAICEEVLSREQALEGQYRAQSKSRDYGALAATIGRLVERERTPLARLKALAAPASDLAIIGQANRMRSRLLALDEQNADALRAEDLGRVYALGSEIRSINDRLEGMDTGYGLTVCAET